MDWNQRYEDEDTPWERGEPAPPLLEYLENEQLSGKVIAPGCGFGHDVRLLAEQGCDALGLDVSPLALERARAYPEPARGSADYQLCDFLDPRNDLPDARFDWLFEHTCFCAIDPSRRADYVKAVERVLKPGGRLLGIFFTDLEDPGDPPFSSSASEIEALFSSDFKIERAWRPKRFFEGREGEETVYLMIKG